MILISCLPSWGYIFWHKICIFKLPWAHYCVHWMNHPNTWRSIFSIIKCLRMYISYIYINTLRNDNQLLIQVLQFLLYSAYIFKYIKSIVVLYAPNFLHLLWLVQTFISAPSLHDLLWFVFSIPSHTHLWSIVYHFTAILMFVNESQSYVS